MRISKTQRVEPITRTQPVKRRETPYQGDIDPAVVIHSSKTHRTVSEAFKDASYAQAFWRSKSDLEEAIDFIEKAFLGFVWVGVVAGLVGAVAYWFIWG
jgi:hypothetical protein